MEKTIMDYDTVSLDDENSAVVIIDQTKLPSSIEIISLKTAKEIWDAIYLLQVRGAPAIGVAAAYGIYVLAKGIDTDDYEKFCGIPDSEHIRKIMKMPVHFLLKSGKGFFVQKEGMALALREELSEVAENPVFVEEIKDVIEYRAMDYYQRRYRKSETL